MTETAAEGIGEAARLTAGLVHIIEDEPHAIQQLPEAAGGRMFDHRVEQLRQARGSAQTYAEAVAKYPAQGYTVIEHTPVWGDLSCVALHHLRSEDGEAVTKAAVTDPTKWAVL
jgi:ParB family transcriptional regulator, chromosome partitioning protein